MRSTLEQRAPLGVWALLLVSFFGGGIGGLSPPPEIRRRLPCTGGVAAVVVMRGRDAVLVKLGLRCGGGGASGGVNCAVLSAEGDAEGLASQSEFLAVSLSLPLPESLLAMRW